MKLIAFLTVFLWSGAALAQPYYMRVTGVAPDDTLNVRAGPSASSDDIGDLPFNARGIEVLNHDRTGDWVRILWQEGNGWLAKRFLETDPVETLDQTALPVGLQCSGTEPFWSMRLTQGGAIYSDLGGRVIPLTQKTATIATGHRDFPLALEHAAGDGRSLSVIQPMFCSDYMTDRDYPYGLTVLLETGGRRELLAGCCWLPLDAGEN